ncbi:MAG: hypothetical protein ABI860_06370 [Gemmatimonadales bacterium]
MWIACVPRCLVIAALAGILGSCSDSGAPNDDTRSPSDLKVVRVAPSSTPLFNASDSFYAKQGEDREVRIYFQDEVGGSGEEYMRLRVDAPTLLALPDGTPILPGDSVLIHIRVVDPGQMLFELEPSGLRFNPLVPARLKIHYDHAGGDINDDGRIDVEDETLERTLSIWRQEKPGDPFVRLTSVLSLQLDEAEAELTGFSRYALAY